MTLAKTKVQTVKHNLTPEQTAARDARKAKFKTLWKQVAAMPEFERIALSNKLGLVTVDGHALSIGNQMLIALQCPSASVLGGFRQWLKHGRCVRKGEHGAMINASAIVLFHNHPSGDSTPSEADIKVTRDLIRAGQLLKIDVLDHVILGIESKYPDGTIQRKGYSSLRELGYFYS